MNKTNLKLLADWLILNNDDLVEKSGFNMLAFRSSHFNNPKNPEDFGGFVIDKYVSETDCGTAGCALGWAPASGIAEFEPLPSEMELGFLVFSEYEDRVFNLSEVGPNSPWDWCFSSEWYEVDNTPKGAAIRILQLISGESPDEWYYTSMTVKSYEQWYKENK